ncbi:MAG: hypothetical protein ACI8Y7_001134 [Candidatus Woesearchaeota archaeon]|jgi:hypothetical protein
MERITWSGCLRRNLAKSVSPDTDLIQSLLVSSHNKIRSSQKLPFEDFALSSKIILAYDALREYLEAYSLSCSYKIYNHECYAAFLLETHDLPTIADSFDRLRKIRNRINYYGEEVSLEQTKMLVKDIKDTLNKCKLHFNLTSKQ